MLKCQTAFNPKSHTCMCMVRMQEVDDEMCVNCPVYEQISELRKSEERAKKDFQELRAVNAKLSSVLVDYAIKKIREE